MNDVFGTFFPGEKFSQLAKASGENPREPSFGGSLDLLRKSIFLPLFADSSLNFLERFAIKADKILFSPYPGHRYDH